MERTPPSIVYFDVGQDFDPKLLDERAGEYAAALQQTAHFARVAGGLRQVVFDEPALLQHVARPLCVPRSFQMGGRGCWQKGGDALPTAVVRAR